MFSSTPSLRYVLFAAGVLLVPNIALAHDEAIVILYLGLPPSVLLFVTYLFIFNANGGTFSRKFVRILFSCALYVICGIGLFLLFSFLSGFSQGYLLGMLISPYIIAYFAPKFARKIIK